ncbi:MAG TPA: AAA family ATPase [bacterium]|nr:AAA family ATPase [bacterium]
MKRKITETFIKWKEKKDKMPLLIHGARQVGKTHIIKEFAQKFYKNSIYINFEKSPLFSGFFESDISPDKLIAIFEDYFKTEILKEETLIIFDEIQLCERALTSLKYFAEDAPGYHIIAAGSLLGVAINREKYSFPVGKVEIFTLYPLDFEEFLQAIGQEYMVDMIKDHFNSFKPLPDEVHSELQNSYKKYQAIGGMPLAVKSFSENNSTDTVYEIQNNILNAYIADMAKYASNNESVKIRGAYESIPAQLAKNNKKFQYKLIRKGATANLFGTSIDWLEMAGIVLKCSKIDHGSLPLSIYKDVSSFKLYMSDTGLYCAKALITAGNLIAGSISDVLKGAVTENFIAQTLVSNGLDLYYWESDHQAEVDFVIQSKTGVIPLEVKYYDNTRSKSLSVFVQKYRPSFSIRVSSKNFGFESNIRSVPHYAAFCINKNI